MRVAIQIFVGIMIIAVFIGVTFISWSLHLAGWQLMLVYMGLFIAMSVIMTLVVYFLQKSKLESERELDEKKW